MTNTVLLAVQCFFIKSCVCAGWLLHNIFITSAHVNAPQFAHIERASWFLLGARESASPFLQTTMAYCVMQVAARPTGCKAELCHYRQRYHPPSLLLLLLYLWLTDANICPLAHSPLPENNCRVHLPWRGLVTGACVRGGGKCRVPAPMTAEPIATTATYY